VTYPLILDFSTHFFSDDRDGLGMIWNVWWTNKAVTQLHQSPFFTDYIFFPQGVTLLAHTLSPFNGFLAVVLLPFLTLAQTYNFLIVFSFVMAGLTAFWLSFYITRSYWPSIVAGFIFSFSNYHFAHTPGHLNLVSLEWIPLFVLGWYFLMKKPSIPAALASAAALFAVLLCDYYYFFYCFLIALMVLVWQAIQRRKAFFFLAKKYLLSLSVFVAASLASSGVLIFKLLALSRKETFIGIHDSRIFSADLLSPFLYGSCLRFSHLTTAFWTKLPGNTSESSLYLGVSVVILLVFVWIQRSKVKLEGLRFLYFLLLFFFVCSLGPSLHIWGKYLPFPLMPYRLLEMIFPPLKISGCPGRMMVIVTLVSAVISAIGLDLLFRRSGRTRIFAAILMAVLFIEFLPFKLSTFPTEVPDYVKTLRSLPPGAVIDGKTDSYYKVYYQTVHEKPLAFGKLARLPKSTSEKYDQVYQSLENSELDKLWGHYGFRYLVLEDGDICDLQKKIRYRRE
jgi:hypothetical protein